MFKCEVCGEKMVITVVDKAGGIAWVCCPEYSQGDDEHDSYQVELTQAVYEEFLQG